MTKKGSVENISRRFPLSIVLDPYDQIRPLDDGTVGQRRYRPTVVEGHIPERRYEYVLRLPRDRHAVGCLGVHERAGQGYYIIVADGSTTPGRAEDATFQGQRLSAFRGQYT